MRLVSLHSVAELPGRILKHLLLRPCQRKPVPVGIEARNARLLRLARKTAALPDLAIGQHRQRRVEHGIAMTDARGGASRVHLKCVTKVEVAIGRASRVGVHRGDIAADRVLLVVVEILAGDVFRRRLEAGGAGLGGRCICDDHE